MYNEEERERPTADGKKLGEREGTENLHHKVKVSITLPDGETGAIAYEPTRGLGHCEGQFSGIVPAPNVSCVEVRHNDIIIVGTDGLWNALGGRRKHGDTSPPKDEVSFGLECPHRLCVQSVLPRHTVCLDFLADLQIHAFLVHQLHPHLYT